MSALLAIAATAGILATMKAAFTEEPAHDMGITLKAEFLAFRELTSK